MSRPVSLWLALALLVAPACMPGGKAGSGFGRGDDDKEEAAEKSAPVVTSKLARATLEGKSTASSTIEAERQVTIHAESTGRIIQLLVEEGDDVQPGQLLARVRYEAQSSGLDRAETTLQKNKADYEVVKELYARRAASKQELESARVAYRTAEIDLRDRSRDLRNTKVVAPFAGTITQRLVGEGGFISSGAQLFTIVDFSSLVARVHVPEKELDRIRLGQSAEVSGKAASGRHATGTVKRIAPVVDAQTGTIKVTVSLPPQTPGNEKGFLPGMYAEVTFLTERRENATVLPKTALVKDEDEAFAYLVEGHRAKRVRLQLGLADAAGYEVLGGLQAGSEVILAGHNGLRDGALVRRVDEKGNPLEEDPAGEAKADKDGQDEDEERGGA